MPSILDMTPWSVWPAINPDTGNITDRKNYENIFRVREFPWNGTTLRRVVDPMLRNRITKSNIQKIFVSKNCPRDKEIFFCEVSSNLFKLSFYLVLVRLDQKKKLNFNIKSKLWIYSIVRSYCVFQTPSCVYFWRFERNLSKVQAVDIGK